MFAFLWFERQSARILCRRDIFNLVAANRPFSSADVCLSTHRHAPRVFLAVLLAVPCVTLLLVADNRDILSQDFEI